MGSRLIIVALLLISIFANGGNVSVARGPAGAMFPFAGPTCPAFSHLTDGSSQLRTGTYANLFAAIGTTWGSVDGTHFTLPNLINRTLRGAGSPTDGNGGTAVALGAFQDQATAKNGLALSDPGHSHNTNGSFSVLTATGNNVGGGSGFAIGVVNPLTAPSTTGITLGAGDSETRSKSYGVNYCIWY